MRIINDYEAMAKLNLSTAEREWVSGRVEMLAGSFKALEAIDTSAVEPLITVLDIQNVLREDAAGKFISRDDLLSNAPEQYDGYFQVPKTLD